MVKGYNIWMIEKSKFLISFLLHIKLKVRQGKDSFINLDQDLLKVVKISGQVESTVQDKITQK